MEMLWLQVGELHAQTATDPKRYFIGGHLFPVHFSEVKATCTCSWSPFQLSLCSCALGRCGPPYTKSLKSLEALI